MTMENEQVVQLQEQLARAEADNRQLQLIVNSHANMRDTAQEQLAEAVILIGQVLEYGHEDDAVRHRRWLEEFLARHAQAKQQEAREPVLARPEHGVSLDEALSLTMDRYSVALDKLAVIEHQEAQGAQVGDECFASPEEYAEARAALATQPAVRGAEQ